MPERKLPRPPEGTPAVYAQDGKGLEATVYAHYFIGDADWLVTEYDPDDDVVFGWACVGDRQSAELGYASVAQMEAGGGQVPLHVQGRHVGNLPVYVEPEADWTPRPLHEAIDLIDRRHGRT